jgi:hypothetical protein
MIAMECTLRPSTLSLALLTSLLHPPSPHFQLVLSFLLASCLVWHVCRLLLGFSSPSLIYRHWLVPIVFLEFNTSELLEETCLLHEFGHVAGGLRA